MQFAELKFLGPVGVGIAVVEFAWCMYTNSGNSGSDIDNQQ